MKSMEMLRPLLLLLLVHQAPMTSASGGSSALSDAGGSGSSSTGGSCEPIKVDLCKSVGYNLTRMPNFAGHKLQTDADSELVTFLPLIHQGCSSELQFFLCSVLVPMCVQTPMASSSAVSIGDLQDAIGPCQPLCYRVKEKCAPVMQGFGYAWPSILDCSKFPPTNNHEHMCMMGPGESGGGHSSGGKGRLDVPPSSFNNLESNPFFMKKVQEQLDKVASNNGLSISKGYKEYIDQFDTSGRGNQLSRPCSYLSRPDDYVQVPRLNSVRAPPCFQKCRSHMLLSSQEMQNNVDIAVAALAAVTASVIGLSLVLHILSSTQEVHYPERSLFFLSLSLVGLNVGLLLRAIFSREDIICQWVVDADNRMQEVMTVEGHRNALCFVTFILTYFFAVCSSSWMLSLSMAWVCSELFSWPPRRLSNSSCFLHAFGWGIPAGLTVSAVLTLGAIQADEVTGVCSVGGQTEDMLLYFVILPEGILLFLVILMLSLVLSSVVLIRNNNSKSRGADNGGKLAAFCVIYFIIKSAMLACAFIEYNGREDLRVRGNGDPSVVASAVSRICLMWLLGLLVAAFVFLFGPGRGISFCSSAPSKRNNSKNGRGENIPFQTVKYTQQPTSSKDLNVTESTLAVTPQRPALHPTVL